MRYLRLHKHSLGVKHFVNVSIEIVLYLIFLLRASFSTTRIPYNLISSKWIKPSTWTIFALYNSLMNLILEGSVGSVPIIQSARNRRMFRRKLLCIYFPKLLYPYFKLFNCYWIYNLKELNAMQFKKSLERIGIRTNARFNNAVTYVSCIIFMFPSTLIEHRIYTLLFIVYSKIYYE